ncbi:MAG: superoxide dismutase family protein [Pseudomonadota bacterium]
MLNAKNLAIVSTFVLCAIAPPQYAKADSQAGAVISTPINRISPDGIGERTGAASLRQMGLAIEIIVELEAFPPGWHAMHVHENPSCAPSLENGVMTAGASAGAHYDPNGAMNMDDSSMIEMSNNTAESTAPRDGKATSLAQARPAMASPEMASPEMMQPARRGRPRGDLPSVYVEADGTTRFRIVTYRLQLDELSGRSIMLHEYGEVPIDPSSPFGGGKRIACAVIE